MKKATFPDKTRINESAYRLSRVYHRLAVAEVDELKRAAQSLSPDPVAVVLGAGPGTATMTLLESRSDITVTELNMESGSMSSARWTKR